MLRQLPDAVAVTAPENLPGAKEPQAAVATNGNIYIAFGAGDTIYCATSRDGGKTFEKPVTVATPGRLSLGMRRGPRIAVGKGGTVVISAVAGRQGMGRDGDLLAWRSADGGKTWRGPAMVNDVPGAAREGLHGMAAAPDGTLACVWLDLRVKGTHLYLSTSRDGGANWEPNRLVYVSPDGSICECCHPSLAFDGRGRLYVLWRNSLGGNRDMYLAVSPDGGKTFGAAKKLGQGTWPLNACPMDGGSLAVSDSGALTTIWRRQNDIYVCRADEPEQVVGKGQQGWAAFGPGGVYSVWLVGRPGEVYVKSPSAATPRLLARDADDPVIAAAQGGKGPVIATWTEGRGDRMAIRSLVVASR